jgi:4-hydroxy-3-methylbut-2-enyl diphosphate reductase
MTASKLFLARPRGFCAGVSRAVGILDALLQTAIRPIYVRRQIVHNSHVIERLQAQGIIFVDEVSEVPEGSLLVFSAHGVSPEVRAQAENRKLKVIDATCPLVAKVHREVTRFAKEQIPIVLIGYPEHDEVIGTLGEAPDQIRIISSVQEAMELAIPGDRIGVITQTTLAVSETRSVLRVLQQRFPDHQSPHQDDICYATENRQMAVRELVTLCKVIVVLGSPNSSNSERLREETERCGAFAFRIDSMSEFQPEWLEATENLGLTAGASTPESVVQDAVARLLAMGIQEVVELGVHESVEFSMPQLPPAANVAVTPSLQPPASGTQPADHLLEMEYLWRDSA